MDISGRSTEVLAYVHTINVYIPYQSDQTKSREYETEPAETLVIPCREKSRLEGPKKARHEDNTAHVKQAKLSDSFCLVVRVCMYAEVAVLAQ